MEQIPLVISIQHFLEYPSTEIGTNSREWGEKSHQGWPLGNVVVIPQSVMKRINDSAISHKLLTFFEEYFKNTPVTLLPGQNSFGPLPETLDTTDLVGNTVVVDSLRKLSQTYPGPILIQTVPLSQASGQAFTCDPQTGEKVIKVIQHKGKTLTPSQRDSLTDLIVKLKRSVTQHFQCSWILHRGEWQILQWSECEPQVLTPKHTPIGSVNPGTYRPLLTGTAIQPGRVQGRCRIAAKPAFPHLIGMGDILVLKQCTPLYVPLLKKAGGLICEERIISPVVLQAIQKLGLPTLVNVKDASQKMTQGQQVLINTIGGRHGIVIRA